MGLLSTSEHWDRRGNGERPESADYHAIARGIRRANRAVILVVVLVLLVIVTSNAIVDAVVLTRQSHNGSVQQCQNQAFDQVLNELLHHQPVTAPPTC